MIPRMRTVTLCLASMLPFFANAAEDNLNASVRGLYAETENLNCLQSTIGFAGFVAQPNANSYSVQVRALIRYNGNGTGTILSGTATTLFAFGGPGPTGNGASGPLGYIKMANLSGDFTYTVARDHSIHLIAGPVTTTETVGADLNTPRGTVVTTGIELQGYASEDFRTIVYGTAVPNPPQLAIEYPTRGDGATYKRICNRSLTEVRIGSEPGWSPWPFSGH